MLSSIRDLRPLSLPTALCLILALFVSIPAGAENRDNILILGDSLSAGYGMALDEAWPTLLQKKLEQEGYDQTVVNASISGETTRGGLTRLPRALKTSNPAVVIVELGGNDGLRGIQPSEMRSNLAAIIKTAKDAGARVLLLGIQIPPNYGPTYTEAIRTSFSKLAAQYHVALVDFFLDGVVFDDGLMQSDGIHPNAAAQPKLLANIWPALQPLLEKDG